MADKQFEKVVGLTREAIDNANYWRERALAAEAINVIAADKLEQWNKVWESMKPSLN